MKYDNFRLFAHNIMRFWLIIQNVDKIIIVRVQCDVIWIESRATI